MMIETHLVVTNNKFLKMHHGAVLCEWSHNRTQCSSGHATWRNFEVAAFRLPYIEVLMREVPAKC